MLFVITLVGAVPPVTTTQAFTEGVVIEHPLVQYIQLEKNYTVNFFLRNISNGVKIDNETTNCTFYLADDTGILLMKSNVDFSNAYWHTLINGRNFSKLGIYPYGISCDYGSALGGELVGAWEVTSTGAPFSIQLSVFYIGIMAILAFLFVITLFGFNTLPTEDPKDFEGKLLDINWLKYLRYPLGILAWGELTMIFFLGWNVAEGYLLENLIAKIFEILYTLNFIALMIALPVMVLYIIVKAIEDAKFQKMITRGIM